MVVVITKCVCRETEPDSEEGQGSQVFGMATGTGSRGWLVGLWLPRAGPSSCALQGQCLSWFQGKGGLTGTAPCSIRVRLGCRQFLTHQELL